MAAKKTKAPQALPTTTAALALGANAFGARYVKPGFAFTPEMDLAFALGYPHYFELIDGHPADESVEAGLAYIDTDDGTMRLFPRGVASRLARAWALHSNHEKRVEPFSKPGAVEEDEARQLVRDFLDKHRGDRLLQLLEALVGSETVLDATLEALESYDEPRWTSTFFGTQTYVLGFLLLRVSPDAAQKARVRLERLYKAKLETNPTAKAVKSLDVMLHGVEGAERSAYRVDGRISPMYATLVNDDPAWVAKTIRASGPPDASGFPNPRHAFLGGEDVLAAEVSWWKKYSKHGSKPAFLERFGHVRSETLLPVFLEMTTVSPTRKPALAWFASHSDFARAFLEAQAAGASDVAKAVSKAGGG